MLSLSPCSLSGTCLQPQWVLWSSPASLGQDGTCCSPLGSAVAKPLPITIRVSVCCLRREKQGCSFRMGSHLWRQGIPSLCVSPFGDQLNT